MNGSKRGSTRAKSGALAALLAAALTVAGCQDSYPIAATRCDHFCDLTQEAQCGDYNPASCVLSCEQGSGGAACYAEFDALLACLEMYETTCENSRFGVLPACQSAQNALFNCADAARARRHDGE